MVWSYIEAEPQTLFGWIGWINCRTAVSTRQASRFWLQSTLDVLGMIVVAAACGRRPRAQVHSESQQEGAPSQVDGAFRVHDVTYLSTIFAVTRS